MTLPTWHQEAVTRWTEHQPAWDIAEALHVPWRDFLQYVDQHPEDFPTIHGGPRIDRSAPRNHPVKRRVRLLANPPRDKPADAEVFLAELDLAAIASFARLALSEARALLLSLHAGETIGALTELHGLSWPRLRTIAEHVGWTTSWRRPGCNNSPRATLVGTMLVTEVIRRHLAGESLAAIGQDAGVSRERIRQIIKREHQPSKLTLARERRVVREAKRAAYQEQRRLARAARFQARVERFRAFIEPARIAWAAGATIDEIAGRFGLSGNAMGWHIHRGRQWLGSDTFPHRMRDEPIWLTVAEDLRQRWLTGQSKAEIAQQYDVSWRVIASWFVQLRERFGLEFLPKRSLSDGANRDTVQEARRARNRQRLQEELIPVRDLWQAGRTLREIADATGMSIGRLGSRIMWARRHLEGDWFPRRQATRSTDDGGAEMERMQALWQSGKRMREIATELGWTVSRVCTRIGRARRTIGADVFPRRNQVRQEASAVAGESPTAREPALICEPLAVCTQPDQERASTGT
jgi:DNA-directed RNA polymerase specialized sigma24 family protein